MEQKRIKSCFVVFSWDLCFLNYDFMYNTSTEFLLWDGGFADADADNLINDYLSGGKCSS